MLSSGNVRSVGRLGRGCMRLGQEEADRLAAELNRDATGLHHEALCPPDDVRQPDGKRPLISWQAGAPDMRR